PSPCGHCGAAAAPYTCPRCNRRLCSLGCYRGHGACAEAFYREQVLQALAAERGAPPDRGRLRAALGRPRELREAGDPQAALGRGLWGRLSPAERAEFGRLVRSGEALRLLPPWRPWWWRRGRPERLVEELGEGELKKARGEDEEGMGEAKKVQRADGKDEGEHEEDERDVEDSEEAPQEARRDPRGARRDPRGANEDEDNGDEEDPGGTEPHQDPPEEEEEEDAEGLAPMPPLPSAVPPLRSLGAAPPSPLLRFQLPNVLYGYAFALSLHRGDQALLPEMAAAALASSAGLRLRRPFSSTAEALHDARHEAEAAGYPPCPLGSAGVLLAVAQLLRGRSRRRPSEDTEAALHHLGRLLGAARRRLRGEEEERGRLGRARKKCLYLLAWSREHGAQLAATAREAARVYAEAAAAEAEVEAARRRLEESWGGSRPPPGRGAMVEELP
ncbi:zinc finger HIT domain-containing protein 2, partial [Oxyura jamaicensis]|uniref:zinc finger HIT domain-containing protein 2 n=1 Tax=Oxyura jamaicensis TaxID=8884 RepID=UPI0015A71FAB